MRRVTAVVFFLSGCVFSALLAAGLRAWSDDQGSGNPKTSESRATEAILNALILANRDAQTGRLADDTRAALANVWALQMNTGELSGAWAWLDFHYEPWESADAKPFGAALAALAMGMAPGGYASSPDVQDNLKLLRGYFE